MIKKLLFISFLLFSTIGFSQKSLVKISAAPNPFTSKTKITFSSDKQQTIYFSVRNLIGKRVFHRKFTVKKGKNTIPFYKNKIQAGMYIYTLRNNKETVSKRFVIK